jgi:signal transduction histidine kinase
MRWASPPPDVRVYSPPTLLAAKREGAQVNQVEGWRPRLSDSTWLDLLLGLAVFAVGALQAARDYSYGGAVLWHCLIPAGMGAAVALHRHRPGLALAVVWLAGVFQVLTSQDLMVAEFGVAIVAYGTARYGSVPVLWASLLSVPAAVPIALASMNLFREAPVFTVLAAGRLGAGVIRPQLVVFSAAAIVLGLPWLLGFALRMRGRAVASQAVSAAAEQRRATAEDQRAQAQQLAEARAEQTRLARDVHDVVGHSLAVILAQAQSGDYLPDSDPERLKQAMRNIAESARTSLQDVRRILAATSSDPRDAGGILPDGVLPDSGPRDGDLGRLLDDVRTAGLDIRETVTGTARPLPGGLAITVYRVTQEMLTNAIKHGAPDRPVYVRRDWTDGLVIAVSNIVREGEPGASGAADSRGLGLEGMRQRLADAGGKLAVSGADGAGTADRTGPADGPEDAAGDAAPGQRVFTARAWLPLPAQPAAAVPAAAVPDLVREAAG